MDVIPVRPSDDMTPLRESLGVFRVMHDFFNTTSKAISNGMSNEGIEHLIYALDLTHQTSKEATEPTEALYLNDASLQALTTEVLSSQSITSLSE